MLDIDTALDILRTEGWGAPSWAEPNGTGVQHPQSDMSLRAPLLPGRFVNQCGRCLSWAQSSLRNMGKQRVWLCEPCSGPNPPIVFVEQTRSWQQIQAARRLVAKAEERERKKLERERKRQERDNRLSRLRRDRITKRIKKNPQPQSAEDPAIRLSGQAAASN